MRILHAISSVDPAGGGPIEGVKQLSQIAKEKGHSIEVVSLDPPEAPFLKAFPLPLYAMGPPWLGYAFSPRLVPWLRENAGKYDIVVVNGIWQYHSFSVWRALRRSETPYVVFTHGMLDPWFKRRYPLKHAKKWLYWPWAEYRVLRDALGVLFTSEEERLLARQSFWLYKAHERVVNYGTAAPPSNQEAQIQQFLKALPHLRNKRLALFMGRIHPKKGCDLALKAFASVLAVYADWHLVMAGPDQSGWKSSLVSLAASLQIANRVTWTGMISGDLKWGLTRSAEVLFLPSHQENFGIVVAEALACGVPVLISDKVNIWREIKEDGCGFVAPDTLAGACSLLSSWLKLAESQKSAMRASAQQGFARRFEIHQASASLLGTVEQLINQRDLATSASSEVSATPNHFQ